MFSVNHCLDLPFLRRHRLHRRQTLIEICPTDLLWIGPYGWAVKRPSLKTSGGWRSVQEKRIQSIENKLISIAEEMIYAPGHPNAGQKIIGSTIATSSFCLTSNGDILRNHLEKATLYSKWQDKYSEKFIETRISEILLRVAECRDTSSIPLEIRELVSEYENHKTEYLVVLPLVGVTVDETLKLGQASLRRYDQIVLDSFETKCRSVINQANIQTEDSRAK